MSHLEFNDLKKAELGYRHESRWELNKCCRGIYGGVSWPGKRPGFAVVVGMDPHKHFDSYDICLIAEYESPSIRKVVRQCGVMDYTYEPDRWIGDWKNDSADNFIRELNSEQAHKSQKLSFSLTPMLEMEPLYPYMLDELKRLLDPKRRMLFLKGSKIINYLGEIEADDISTLVLGDYPAIEAICFAVFSMLDTNKYKRKRPLPKMQDMTFKIGAA